MAPLAHSLAAIGLTPSILFTGQHPALSPAEFGLEEFSSDNLGCPGQRDPARHVRAVTSALLGSLGSRPDLIVVQGDTSSALGGAMAGFAAGIPVAHVEAGLRTHDPRLPWPEELYRVAIDREAELLFAPTAGAAANLRAEKVRGEIHVTGNTAIDAVLAAQARLPPASLRETGKPQLLVTCHRRESWGDGLQAIAGALVELAATGKCLIDFILHPNPMVRARMEELLGGREGIDLLDPCGHLELLRRLRDADLALSDSGGIQEEAPTLGVPLLVLREKTERPEGINAGNCRLVGTSSETIVREARRLIDEPMERLAMSRRTSPYGDGRAGPRIAALIGQWMAADVPETGTFGHSTKACG